MNTRFNYFTLIATLSLTCSIVSILLPYKILQLGTLTLPGGVILFPLTYLFEDIIAEIYGFEAAKQLILMKVLCLTLFSLAIAFIIQLPSPATWHDQAAYNLVYGHRFKLLLGFIVGLGISDLTNTYFISKWKISMRHKYFALRSIGAAAIGEALFSIIVGMIVYVGVLSFQAYLKITVSVWVFKFIYSLIIAYPGSVVVSWLKENGDQMIDHAIPASVH
jgi:uncharacterized integral membrane protein (TIGR00697 family)